MTRTQAIREASVNSGAFTGQGAGPLRNPRPEILNLLVNILCTEGGTVRILFSIMNLFLFYSEKNKSPTWQSMNLIISMAPSGQGVMKLMRWIDVRRPIGLQVILAPAGVGGVFAVASRARWGE